MPLRAGRPAPRAFAASVLAELAFAAMSAPLDTATQDLLARMEDRVCVLTLNRPAARNALSAEMKRALLELLPRLARDPGVGCVLLTGAGGAFCAGADTRGMAAEGRPLALEEDRRAVQERPSQVAVVEASRLLGDATPARSHDRRHRNILGFTTT